MNKYENMKRYYDIAEDLNHVNRLSDIMLRYADDEDYTTAEDLIDLIKSIIKTIDC